MTQTNQPPGNPGRLNSIGFASFASFRQDHLAIGSTVLAPRIGALVHYINDLLGKLGIELTFEIQALTYTLPKKEAVKLAHVGAFSMKVESGNRIWDSVVGSLGLGDRTDFDIGSMTVTIHPGVRGGDNKKALLAALAKLDVHGLKSFDARAKIDLADKMADIYIVGAGGIRDPINTSDESTIAQQINQAIDSNSALGDRLDDFRKDANMAPAADPSKLGLAWPPAGVAGVATGRGTP